MTLFSQDVQYKSNHQQAVGEFMIDSVSSSSLRAAFKYPFETKNWILPFVIGTALIFASMVIPIIPVIFVYGYFAEVMRRAINDDALTLPSWDNWGQFFKDGLRCLAVGAVYLGPGILVSMIGFVAYFVMFIASIALTPSSYDTTTSGLVAFIMMGAMGVLFLSMFVSTFLLIAGAIPLPAAIANFLAHDKLSAAFHVREWGAILRADKWGYLIAWLVYLGMFALMYIGFMLAYFTFILCAVAFLAAIPIGLYMMMVSAAIFGQYYRESARMIATNTQAMDPAD
jgi:hypothetical protein